VAIEPINVNGSPSAPGLFEAATAVVACANNLTVLRDALASTTGAVVSLWSLPGTAFPPATMMLQDNATVLIAFGGNHDFALKVGEQIIGGAVPVRINGGVANASMVPNLHDTVLINVINALPKNIGDYAVIIAGHSSGGAYSLQLAFYMLSNGYEPRTLDVFTMGEPRSLLFGYAGPEPRSHFRTTQPYDVVCIVPPKQASYNLFIPGIAGTVLPSQALQWTGHGTIYQWGGQSLTREEDDTLDYNDVVLGQWNADSHNLVNSYYSSLLAWYRNRGVTDQDANLFAAAQLVEWNKDILPGDYGPPSAAAVNDGFFPQLQPGPATPNNLSQWETLALVPEFFFTFGGGPMTQMRGEFFFNQGGQGFTETLHDATGSATYAQMMTNMKNVLPFRQKMMSTSLAVGPVEAKNLCSVVAIRVSDDALKRDGFIQSIGDQATASSGGNPDNWPPENCWAVRVYYTPVYWSLWYFHAVARFATYPADSDRRDQPEPGWTTALNNYIQALQANELGSRYATFPWWSPYPPAVPPAPYVPPAPSGMSKIYACAPSTINKGAWSITVAQNMPAVRTTMRLTGFAGAMAFLNGRRPCVQIANNQFDVLGNFPTWQTWNGTGDATPIVWVPFTPSTTFAATADVFTTRKVGAPYGFSRGRIRRRAVS
jgi:hypothetical protein